MTVRELYSMLENKYPRELSAPWDNDGLMCCADPGAEVKKGLSITGSQAANSKSSVQKWLSANGLM